MVAEVKASALFTHGAEAISFRTADLLPSFHLTLTPLDDDSDSDLSDPPTDLDMMNSEFDSSPTTASRAKQASKRNRSSKGYDRAPARKKRHQRTSDEDTEEEDSDDDDTAEDEFETTEAEHEIVVGDISKFESLPKEVRRTAVAFNPIIDKNQLLQRIALDISTDRDLINLLATCRRFAAALSPENSGVWKAKFTSKYDHPIISGPFDYCWAYKERTLVLGNFIDFGNGQDKRLPLQLQVLQDMVYGE